MTLVLSVDFEVSLDNWFKVYLNVDCLLCARSGADGLALKGPPSG